MQGVLPSWLRGKESACQHRRHEFNLWVGKIPWRRKWQPTAVSFSGKSHGQRSLEGYSPRGRGESDTTGVAQHTHAHKVMQIISFILVEVWESWVFEEGVHRPRADGSASINRSRLPACSRRWGACRGVPAPSRF